MSPAPDRLEQLVQQNAVVGIDFVYVHASQTTLDVVFFLHDSPPQPSLILGTITPDKIHIFSSESGEDVSAVEVTSAAWTVVDGRDALRLTTVTYGNFALYRLNIDDPKVDLYYNNVLFSFKANCPSDLDCERKDPDCPPSDLVDYPVDYRPRDFGSFRRALLDFASQRYPDWQDRLEADIGIMLVEVMSALGDELAYYQDRIAHEAYLETATQRRSIQHHARLVDYEVHNGLAASTWLDVTVRPTEVGLIALPAGMDVWAVGDDARRVSYEVGRHLADRIAGQTFGVNAAINALEPHIWDEDDICLHVGATSMFLKGKHKGDLVFDDPPEDPSGKWVSLETRPVDPSVTDRRWIVRLVNVAEDHDDVFGEDITRLEWEKTQALPYEMDLEELTVHGNLVPVTAGRTIVSRFVIGVDPSALGLPDTIATDLRRAVERVGANDTLTYLCSLIEPELLDEDKGKKEAEDFLLELNKPQSSQLTWLGSDPSRAHPEIYLEEVEFDGVAWVPKSAAFSWDWRRSLMGVNSSLPVDRHYTLEDGVWDRVVGYWRSGQEIVHLDYRSSEGFTIRFGDGEFGLPPSEKTVFQAVYRLGNGRRTNLPADSLTHFDPSLTFIQAVTNPLAAGNGQDAETFSEVRQLAPEAFRYLAFRAVRPEDYAEAVERLDWVQRAAARPRWTGSWLTVFATPDPEGAVALTESQRLEAIRQVDRFRQAGREAWVNDPRYADLDLEIAICVQPFAYIGEVKEAVMEALTGKPEELPRSGFFSPDYFTFGTPLKRSALEGTIQAVAGVRAVENIRFRRRGWFDWRDFTEMVYKVAADEVLRVENDPIHPARGSIHLIMDGGA